MYTSTYKKRSDNINNNVSGTVYATCNFHESTILINMSTGLQNGINYCINYKETAASLSQISITCI